MKTLITILIAGVFILLCWNSFRELPTLDARDAVTKATVVAYGHVVSSPRSHIVIDEIWKPSGSSDAVAVGTEVPFEIPDTSVDHALVCISRRLLSRQLVATAIFAIRNNSAGSPVASLSELKALCGAQPHR